MSWEPPRPGAWSRDFRLGEWLGDPVTPLFESWLLTAIEDGMHHDYGELLGIDAPQPTHVLVNGWYFYGLNFMPARPAAMLAMMVRHILPRLVMHPRRTAIAFPPLAHLSVGLYEREWRTEIRPSYRRLVTQGATWDRRETIVDRHFRGVVVDPDDNARVRTGDILPEPAVDPNSGALYVVWQDARFGPRSSVAFSQSLDGGLTWSPTIKINQTPTTEPLGDQQAFLPLSVRLS